MKIEIGKKYMTKNGRFIIVMNEPWDGVFNTEIEPDGRKRGRGLGEDSLLARHTIEGICEDYLFGGQKVTEPDLDIVMEDSPEAREIAAQQKLERKQKAYEETQ